MTAFWDLSRRRSAGEAARIAGGTRAYFPAAIKAGLVPDLSVVFVMSYEIRDRCQSESDATVGGNICRLDVKCHLDLAALDTAFLGRLCRRCNIAFRLELA